MPLLKITESKKVTAIITIEDATARQIEQYAAMTKGNPDEVVQQALDYVFSKDKDFETYCRDHADAKPKIALRLKRPATQTPSSADAKSGARPGAAAVR
jgi:hypothetical protein